MSCGWSEHVWMKRPRHRRFEDSNVWSTQRADCTSVSTKAYTVHHRRLASRRLEKGVHENGTRRVRRYQYWERSTPHRHTGRTRYRSRNRWRKTVSLRSREFRRPASRRTERGDQCGRHNDGTVSTIDSRSKEADQRRSPKPESSVPESSTSGSSDAGSVPEKRSSAS